MTEATTPLPGTRPWGFWATVGLSFVVLLIYFLLQILATFAFLLATGGPGGPFAQRLSSPEMAYNGTLIAVAILISAPVATGLTLLFARLRPGARLTEYLGWRKPSWGQVAFWLGVLVVFLGLYDLCAYWLGRPLVPPFMVTAYRTAGSLPALWVAVGVLAPLFEEILFRGFLLEGLRVSRLGALGAVVLTAFVWTAIHLQYDLYDMTWVLLLGLTVGAAKVHTGSLQLVLGLHVVNNLAALVEVALHVQWGA